MRTTVSRWLAIAAVISLSLALALPLLTSTSQEAFASTRVHTSTSTPSISNNWTGLIKYNNGSGVFTMDVALVSNNSDYGTLTEGGIGEAEILWSYSPIGGNGYGTFTMTTLERLSGNICADCGYEANFDNQTQTTMGGVWNYGNGQVGGSFALGS